MRPDGYQPLLAALAFEAHDGRIPVDVVDVEIKHLADPGACAIEELQQRAIPDSER